MKSKSKHQIEAEKSRRDGISQRRASALRRRGTGCAVETWRAAFQQVACIILLMAVCFSACKEQSRFETEWANKTPTGPPSGITWKPLYGGARFHYTAPKDANLLSIDAEYINDQGERFFFTSALYKDSIDVYGFGAEKEYTVYLYGVNRAGVPSEKIPVQVVPLEPAVTRVVKTIEVKPAFSSFFFNFENELEQLVSVYVTYKFTENGSQRELVQAFSSNNPAERLFVKNIKTAPDSPVNISFRVADFYGNSTAPVDFGDIYLLEDFPLDKSIMRIPEANDSTVILRNGARFNTGVPAVFGDNQEGRMVKILDGLIDEGDNSNFMHCGGRGRTGVSKDGHMPWNIILDLGDYYRLSRINTVQRNVWQRNDLQDCYYRWGNVGHFRLYYFDEDEKDNIQDNKSAPTEHSKGWVLCSEQKTPIPMGISDLQIYHLGRAGDEAFFFPDDPQYTKPTRWFRYEALHGFNANYSVADAQTVSEMTVYGTKN